MNRPPAPALALSGMRVLLAGYGMPAEYGASYLFSAGLLPENLLVLTPIEDDRNSGFVRNMTLRGVRLLHDSPAAPAIVTAVNDFKPDLLLSLHFRSRLPDAVINAARCGAVNLHPSLLPKYRGTNSVPWAIINGEHETGFTYHYMESKFDTGRIILQEKLAVFSNETAFSLFHRQICCALTRLPEVVELALGGFPGVAQTGDASYFSRRLPFEGFIDPTWDRPRKERFIRAMYFPPFPGAKLLVNGEEKPVNSLEDVDSLLKSST